MLIDLPELRSDNAIISPLFVYCLVIQTDIVVVVYFIEAVKLILQKQIRSFGNPVDFALDYISS